MCTLPLPAHAVRVAHFAFKTSLPRLRPFTTLHPAPHIWNIPNVSPIKVLHAHRSVFGRQSVHHS